ncbi:probable calcium-binding protein CML16 [Cynara cardunculus var. scolymus]|uniref:probable calcium-binding protein CML16 n=1 Tax=Cynara cardunculus var. scolymus TaxID=59895 RepID=UPI000D62A20A|nr:probable calcium-binding protein CML16 [Cynara cardunculus var. scolymus]
MAQLPSANQVNLLKDIFTRFDLDSDGSLTQLELAALFRSVGLIPVGDEFDAVLAKMDANGNGSIEFEELLNAILPDFDEEVFVNQDQLMKVFQLFDKDGDGSITPAELAGQMAKMGLPLTYRELNDLMNDIDTNGDGIISFHEFTAILGMPASEFLGIKIS